jgi:hypothetical protein
MDRYSRGSARPTVVDLQRKDNKPMGLLADFYVSTDDDAVSYDDSPSLPDSDRAQHTGITHLELSTLWAILQEREWDVTTMDEFRCLLERDGGERLIHRFPAALVAQLATSDAGTLRLAAAAWAQTEELSCDPSDIQPVVDDLMRLARRAQETGKSLFVWNCV